MAQKEVAEARAFPATPRRGGLANGRYILIYLGQRHKPQELELTVVNKELISKQTKETIIELFKKHDFPIEQIE